MPAARPRMHVTPSANVHALLGELSRLSGKPPATFVREMLDEAVPALERLVEAFRIFNESPQNALQAVDRLLEETVKDFSQARLDLDKAMEKKPGRKPAVVAEPRRRTRGQGAAKTG